MNLPVKGMRDILDEDYLKFEHIIETSKSIIKKYGFSGIETPILEHTSVFQKSLGETSDVVGKEMYSFLDKRGNSLTLRPEGTAAIARALVTKKITKSKKLFYVGPFFRYERPQKGRYRQFTQLSVEWVFSKSPFADAELINCAAKILKELGIDFNIHIGTLGDKETRDKFKNAFVEYLKPFEKDLSEDSKERLHKNPLRILDSKDPSDIEICLNSPKLLDFMTDNSKKHFDAVLSNLETDVIVDKNLVRGLDYYCHTIFEIKAKSLGAQDTILAGGRYDGLLGKDSPSVGWSLGVDRAMLLLDEVKKPKSIGIAYVQLEQMKACLSIAKALRCHGNVVQLSYQDSIGKRMKELDHLGCEAILIIGEDEIEKGFVTLKNLKTNTETQINRDELKIWS